MQTKLIATGLIAFTAATVAFFPAVQARFVTPGSTGAEPVQVGAPPPAQVQSAAPRVEAVFVLDTTGSMSGLIAAAKEKIWSIATTLASANHAPEIRMGLVAYRDRGDAYVTKVVDLSADLDTVYATLMDFRADGGGDTPESVNEALHDAVHEVSWSEDQSTYRVVFLVGDAPPHTDYVDDVPYARSLEDARRKGIVVNTIQAGQARSTERAWRHIARIADGEFLRVDQGGDAVAIATPYDAELATLSSELDETRLYYGDEAQRARQREKQAAAERLHESASVETRARRAAFNASQSGKVNRIGKQELVDDVSAGRVDLDALPADQLPAKLRAVPAAKRETEVRERARRRAEIEEKMETLARKRDAFLDEEVEARGGAKESLDQKLYDAVRSQARKAGLVYESSAPRY